ncbi:MAG: hypothetical protein FWE69_07655 [Clostridiales bacterium]|nr:hypothetical protein [Clostridiales bacterium]
MTVKKNYFISLTAIVLASVYPLYMGVTALLAYLRDGGIIAEQYPRYIIPFTPISIALIVAVAFMPQLFKLLKRFAQLGASVLGLGVFVAAELALENTIIIMENVPLLDSASGLPLEYWQLALCRELTEAEAQQVVMTQVPGTVSPLAKLHFYLIAVLIVLSVIGVVYGFSRMIREGNREKRVPLWTQLAAVAAFVGVCIWVCFTGFYRTDGLNVSALTAGMNSLFLLLFGLTAGTYAGTLLTRQKPILARWLPAMIAFLATLAIYLGQFFVLGRQLYHIGPCFPFLPIFSTPFSAFDFGVMLLSGAVTWLILWLIRPQES